MNCPDCNAEIDVEKNHLTDEEYTTIMDCPACDFGIETESNLV